MTTAPARVCKSEEVFPPLTRLEAIDAVLLGRALGWTGAFRLVVLPSRWIL
jgi:hypothetical protein